MTNSPDPNVLREVQQLIRRDLKLAADEPLPPDMPLFGSAIDLDSLDMLLLVTSLERTFGVRVPNQAIGREVFQSVGAMASYVQAHRGTVTPGPREVVTPPPPPPPPLPASANATPAPADPVARLPHGPAFRFVSRVLDVQPGRSARCLWQLDGTEPFFAAHFPGDPLVPGVLIGEALAQTAGIAAAAGSNTAPFAATLAHLDVRFDQPVRPPAEIDLSANLVSVQDRLFRFDVIATASQAVVARGTLTLHRSS